MAQIFWEYVLIAVGVIVVLVFIKEINEWRIRRLNREGSLKFASKGATIQAPPNITATILSVKRYTQGSNPDLALIKGIDTKGKEHSWVINPLTNIKIYNPENSLLDKDETVFILNVSETGEYYDSYLGIDFMPSAIDTTIGRLQSENMSLKNLLDQYAKIPLDAQHQYERSQLQGAVARNITGATTQSDARNPTVVIENVPNKEEESEESK